MQIKCSFDKMLIFGYSDSITRLSVNKIELHWWWETIFVLANNNKLVTFVNYFIEIGISSVSRKYTTPDLKSLLLANILQATEINLCQSRCTLEFNTFGWPILIQLQNLILWNCSEINSICSTVLNSKKKSPSLPIITLSFKMLSV